MSIRRTSKFEHLPVLLCALVSSWLGSRLILAIPFRYQMKHCSALFLIILLMRVVSALVPLTNENINSAVSLWEEDQADARRMYGDIITWDVSRLTQLNGTFSFSEFNDDLSRWDVSRVTTLDDTFHMAEHFNSDLSRWDISRVTSMENTFYSVLSMIP